jgi:serine protease Do
LNNKLGYFISSFLGIIMGTALVIGGNQLGVIKLQVYNNSTGLVIAQAQPVSVSVHNTTSNISSAAKRLTPAVVGITSVTSSNNTLKDKEGMGSGIIADKRGYILTNNHVAGKDADEIKVFLYDNRTVKGKVVWADESLDLSIVKINADNLPVAPLGDSETLTVGDTAIAIGNPLGLTFQRTVTSGIISATNRTVGETGGPLLEGLIQTDASINPGNSGGPLININGEVIGINTIKVTSAEGMGLAIPINIAKPILNNILEKGTLLQK